MAVQVTHFSDLLCVWAYVGEARLTELRAQFGDDIAIEHRMCSVFGDTAGKIGAGWRDRGGYEGFAAHVRAVADQFELSVHPELWITTRPASSEGAHLLAKACQLLEARDAVAPGSSEQLLGAFREAFFREGQDIAQWSVHEAVADRIGLPVPELLIEIRCGAAHAALARDAHDRDQWGVQGSPTLLLNKGRQKLYGNVGYRVMEANIQEILRVPGAGEASWC